MIFGIVEPCNTIRDKVGRSAYPVESINDQHHPFLIFYTARRKNFGWETLPSLIQGGHFIAIDYPGFLVQPDLIGCNHHSVIEIGVSLTRI